MSESGEWGDEILELVDNLVKERKGLKDLHLALNMTRESVMSVGGTEVRIDREYILTAKKLEVVRAATALMDAVTAVRIEVDTEIKGLKWEGGASVEPIKAPEGETLPKTEEQPTPAPPAAADDPPEGSPEDIEKLSRLT